jgi:hypothetical protein
VLFYQQSDVSEVNRLFARSLQMVEIGGAAELGNACAVSSKPGNFTFRQAIVLDAEIIHDAVKLTLGVVRAVAYRQACEVPRKLCLIRVIVVRGARNSTVYIVLIC